LTYLWFSVFFRIDTQNVFPFQSPSPLRLLHVFSPSCVTTKATPISWNCPASVQLMFCQCSNFGLSFWGLSNVARCWNSWIAKHKFVQNLTSWMWKSIVCDTSIGPYQYIFYKIYGTHQQ
jgi:hypothetical protein